jgi:hypothetical protein
MSSSGALFCLSCGEQEIERLPKLASLRCRDCREARAPISLQLALRFRRPRATDDPGDDFPYGRSAA